MLEYSSEIDYDAYHERIEIREIHIPAACEMHWGMLPFQSPSLWQTLASFPTRRKPLLQA